MVSFSSPCPQPVTSAERARIRVAAKVARDEKVGIKDAGLFQFVGQNADHLRQGWNFPADPALPDRPVFP